MSLGRRKFRWGGSYGVGKKGKNSTRDQPLIRFLCKTLNLGETPMNELNISRFSTFYALRVFTKGGGEGEREEKRENKISENSNISYLQSVNFIDSL